jgi:hypothetical protein
MSAPDNLKDLIRRANCDATDALRRRLWQDVAAGLRRSPAARTGSSVPAGRIVMNSKIARLAIAGLIGIGGMTAVVVGVNVGRYYFEGKQADGTYRFTSEQTSDGGTDRDANGVEQPIVVQRVTEVTVGPDSPDGTLDVEQTRRDLEEIDRLRQQNIRRLRAVTDTETNAGLHRAFLYEYTLSNGRTFCGNEGDPGDKDGTGLTTAQWNEFHQLRRAGKGQDAGTQEKEVKGHLFSFRRQRFILSDGTEVIQSEGRPKDNQ